MKFLSISEIFTYLLPCILSVSYSSHMSNSSQVGTYDVIKLSEMDFSEDSPSDKKVSSKADSQSSSAKSTKKTDASSADSAISVKVEGDLDESSQGSTEFAANKGEESCCGKVYLKKKNAETTSGKKTVLRLPQVSTCRVGSDR